VIVVSKEAAKTDIVKEELKKSAAGGISTGARSSGIGGIKRPTGGLRAPTRSTGTKETDERKQKLL